MKKQFGFTLVELLIVIALLGALAVGLLASLDPFEQFKKGSDTGTRNTVSELQSAAIRYYSIKNQMPWQTIKIGTTVTYTDVNIGVSNPEASQIIEEIVTTGELKSEFEQLAANQLSKITLVGGPQSVTVCFMPTSKSFRNDANTKYGPDGGDKTAEDIEDCKANVTNDAAFDCYWCLK